MVQASQSMALRAGVLRRAVSPSGAALTRVALATFRRLGGQLNARMAALNARYRCLPRFNSPVVVWVVRPFIGGTFSTEFEARVSNQLSAHPIVLPVREAGHPVHPGGRRAQRHAGG